MSQVTPSLVLDRASPVPAFQAADVLGLAAGAEVFAIERLRFTGDEPLALMRNHVPVTVVELDAGSPRSRGLYDLLRVAGISLKIATQTIGGRAAEPAEARLLDERAGAPLLTMSRTTYDDTGRAVEYGAHLYRASRYTFELTLTTG